MTELPTNPVTPIADGVWGIDILKRFPLGVRLPLRGTIVRLAGGDLWVQSPPPLTPALAAAVDAIGPVRHLVGPNKLHHLSLGDWSARYPAARLWAAPGLSEKRTDLSFAGTIGADGAGAASSVVAISVVPWAAEVEPLLLDGAPGMNEVVFLHRASRTLICTDLVFNIRQPATRATALLLALAGTRGRFAMSRVWRRYRKDRAALRASVERLLDWDFVRVVPAHGEVFDAGSPAAARATTRATLAWMLR